MRAFSGASALVLIACALSCGAGVAQEAVPLAFKFEAGESIRYEFAISGSASIVASGEQVTPVTMRGAVTVLQNVTRVFPDGSAHLETRIPAGDLTITVEREQVKFTYADGRFRWFANGKESAPPTDQLGKVPFLAVPVLCTMLPDGRVKDVSLADPTLMSEFAKALPKIDLSSVASAGDSIFPGRPVKVGETWRTSASAAPLGPMFPVTVTSSRTLDSYHEEGGFGLAKIVGVTEARVRAGPTAPLLGQEVRIGISDLRHTVNSTEFFNVTAGRLLRGDYDLFLAAQVTAQAAGEQRGAGIEARLRVNLQAR